MAFADFYLNKYSQQTELITEDPDSNLGLVIVIPSYKEEFLLLSIESLALCNKPIKSVEIIIVMNAPENVSDDILQINKNAALQLNNWIENNTNHFLKIHLIQIALPIRDAGVGLARKIGMDEAVRRFNKIENKNGIIAGFDADSTCATNYLTELEKLFITHPKATGCSVHFEHPIEGSEYPPIIYQSILLYELYLRYYYEALRFCNFPFAFHTLGSSFAVKATSYCSQGGMNKRKAGEDFYFLHKIIPLGEFYELTTTTIYPSPRTSDRVPFGTGAAINKMLLSNDLSYNTFNPNSFFDLKNLFDKVDLFFEANDEQALKIIKELNDPLCQYLIESKAIDAIRNANENSASIFIFRKRFYQWMNGLLVLQYLNFAHQKHYDRIPVVDATNQLLYSKNIINKEITDLDLLLFLRNKQRNSFRSL